MSPYYTARFICDMPLRVGQVRRRRGVLPGSLAAVLGWHAAHSVARSRPLAAHPISRRPLPSLLPPQGLLFGGILYWIVGLNPTAEAFFIFCFLVICEGLAAQGLGVAIAAGACLRGKAGAEEGGAGGGCRPAAGGRRPRPTAGAHTPTPPRALLSACPPAACPDEKVAIALAPLVTIILMLFGG